MKLIFIHGSPAVGKLTVAKALLRLVPARLMDNHSNVDLARTIFDFGVPVFGSSCIPRAASRCMPRQSTACRCW
jgi:tRNA uridine 5-carbamoylmethylation protein Kti12